MWGRNSAVMAWLCAVCLTAAFALMAAWEIEFPVPALVIVVLLVAAAVTVAFRFLFQPVTTRAKWIEVMAGVWTVGIYLTLGLIPLLSRRIWKGLPAGL